MLGRNRAGLAVAQRVVLILAVLGAVLTVPAIAHADPPGVWSASGPGVVTLNSDGTDGHPSFGYSINIGAPGTGPGVPTQTWTFQTTAATSGSVTVPYTYTGNHAFFDTFAFLNGFVTDNGTTTPTSLLNVGPGDCFTTPCSPPSSGFSYSGSYTFNVSAGDTYGFTLGGSNFDNNSFLNGTLTLDTSAFNQAAPVGNTSWPTASTLAANDTATDAIDTSGEERWYKFPVQPDSQVQVSLSNLPADDNIALFSDIGQTFASQQASLTGGSTSDLTQLTAEQPGNASSPSIFSPSIFSPSIFSPSIFSPSIFSPSTSSPSIFSPSIFSPSIFSPSIFSPAKFEQAYATAQVDSLLAVSTQTGTANKTVSADTWNNTGFFYVRVSGNNGAAAAGDYSLSVTTTGGPCGTQLDTHASDATLTGTGTSGVQTVILTDSSRMDMSTVNGPLGQLATQTNGVVVNVNDSLKVRALNAQADANPACPYAKNLVAQAIRDIVNSYRGSGNNLKYVVIVGDDDVVPFFRYPDSAGLAPESGYVPPLLSTSAAAGAQNSNDFLSDDAYGAQTDLSVKGSTLPIPDLAVGRLVEQPSDIITMIDEYLDDHGQLPTPTSSLVTGYDFMQPAADQVETEFKAGLGSGATNDTLITNQGVSPSLTTPAGGPDRDHSWTASDLRNSLLGSHHDLLFLGGHFSANNTLAADYSSTLVTTDVKQAVQNDPSLFTNSLVLSAGCHGGDNLEDADGVPGVTLGLDWPQEFAASGATLISGTGYQYGDTDFVAYSDKLYVELAKELRSGATGSSVPIGQALLQAKQDYLGGVTQISGLDEKSMLEATLYGLPMLGITMPGDRTGNPSSTSTVNPSAAAGPGGVLGLQTASLSISPTLTTNTPPVLDTQGNPTGGNFTYLSGPNGVVSNPAEPTLPLDTEDVTVPGEVLRGVGFRSGTYADTTGITPLTGAPATELNSVHTSFVSPVFYPQTLWNPNYYGALAGPNGETKLLITPAQHRSDPGSSTTDTLRQYSNLGLKLYYSNNTQTYGANTPALAGPPTISAVTSTVNPDGSITFSAQVAGDPSAGIQDAWVTYTGNSAGDPLYGSWQSLDLTQSATDSTVWQGTLPAASAPSPSDVSFMVQAANGVGLVAMDNNNGAYFTSGVTVGGPSAPGSSTLTLDSGNPTSGAYGGTANVSATLSGADPAGRPITFGLGSTVVTATTDDNGVANASLPLSADPGSYDLTASFDGSALAQPASTNTPDFQITKAASTLSMTGPAGSVVSGKDTGVQTTLTSGGLPLRQKPVYFSITDSSGTLVATAVRTTDLNGQAQLGALTLPPGALSVAASFGADSVSLINHDTVDASDPDYGASTNQASLAVTGATTTTLSAPATSLFNGSLTLTATVTSTDGGGTVGFTADGSPVSTCATQSLSSVSGSYQATCAVSGLAVGLRHFTATYSGDTNYLTSTSDQASSTVNPATTATTLTAPTTSLFGGSLTLTATVAPTDGGGTVKFIADGSPVTGCGTQSLSSVSGSYQATCTVSGLAVGSHSFKATYSGDTNYANSDSSLLGSTVNPAGTTTTVTAPKTSAYGGTLTLTAKVAPNDGGGTVEFLAGSTAITGCTAQSVTLVSGNEQATCVVTGLSVGSHSFTAVYSGDTSYLTSTSGPATSTVNQAATSTTLTSPTTSSFGVPVTLTATVAPNDGGGTVKFLSGSSAISACTARPVALVSGSYQATCSVTGLALGSHSFTAVYSGDTNYLTSTSGSTTTTVKQAATTTTLASPNTAPFGAPVTLTATVAPTDGGGSVKFTADGASIGGCTARPVALVSGSYQATCSVTGLALGSHSFTAVYSGDTNYLSSNPGTATTTVNPAATTTTLTSPKTSGYGAPVTLTATVAPVAPGAGTPAGTVTFFDGSGIIGTAPLVLNHTTGADAATLAVSALKGGIHSLNATYAGNSSFLTSTATATDTVTFSQTITGTYPHNITVTSGQQVLITGVVQGVVTVLRGGSLAVNGGTINGPLLTAGATGITLCGAKINGPTAIVGSTGYVFVGGGTGCAASSVTGGLAVSSNTAGVAVIGSTITGPVLVTDNSGLGPVQQNGAFPPPEIAGNTISGPLASLSCSGNNPPPTDAGQPNHVPVRLGQCSKPATF